MLMKGQRVKLEKLQEAIEAAEEEGLPYAALNVKRMGAAQLITEMTASAIKQAIQWAKEVEKAYVMLEGEESVNAKETRDMLADVGMLTAILLR